ncbi:hypothetical protein SAMN05444340_107153 [Citreimonas salinaria]|uniref:Uncharacterized protein n=2 Tax=Citreimonas salinaria TaxID=321339 RepID=A0A1H3JQB6_9RHOB|nr:hypothetical protein SAMN05444340_107153 [Citreimonas salinaria]
MQVILHCGVHCTDDDRLLKGLLRNADMLRAEGTAVPGPSRYRTLLSEIVNALDTGTPAPAARDVVLDEILDMPAESTDRVVLCHPDLFSVRRIALAGGRLYRKAESRLAMLRDLFAEDQVELVLGLRDMGSFLPALLAATPHEHLDEVLHGADPTALRWSDLIVRIRAAVPGMPITVWCNEDTPLLWGQILREVAGLPPDRKITGAFDLFGEIVRDEGMRRFRAFLKDNPGVSEDQKRRLMAAFLDKYAIEDALEEELDLPGWDATGLEALSAAYDADLDRIAEIPGVRVLVP